MRKPVFLCAAAAALFAPPLAAQATTAPAAGAAAATTGAAPTAGATVYDPQGGTVGTIESVSNGVAVVSTGTNKVGLPVASFGTGANGPVISMTKAELDAAAGQAAAASTQALKAQLASGATVYGKAGAPVGTVQEADDQYVTLKSSKGPVKLPIAAFSKGDKGAMLSMTAEELDAAVTAATQK